MEYATNGPEIDRLWIAAAGAVISLIQGVLALQFAERMKTKVESLFFLWFGIVGLITFFGYLMIAL